MATKPIVAMLVPKEDAIFDDQTIAKNKVCFELRWPAAGDKGPVSRAEAISLLKQAQGCVTHEDSPRLDHDLLDQALELQIVAHAGASTASIVSERIWSRKIKLTSGAASHAVDVAHFTIGVMIIGLKQLMRLAAEAKAGKWHDARAVAPPNDLRGATVGIISASHIGRNVLGLLRHFEVEALLYDPYCSEALAASLNAKPVSLEHLFRCSDIVSLHAPDIAETRHMVNAQLLSLMKPNAIFINTARGELVDEGALVRACAAGRITAYLDATDPEPPGAYSPLFNCPNLTLTPRISGSMGRARKRMGALAFKELQRHFSGQPPLFPVENKASDKKANTPRG